METMEQLIERLELERDQHAGAVRRLNNAIESLRQGSGSNGRRKVTTISASGASPAARKTMSPEARRKISLAMKKRHAAARKGHSFPKASSGSKKKLHWTQTPEGRKKFAAIRARSRAKAA
jgi:hypothetical protein